VVRSLATDMPEASQAELAGELELVHDYIGSMITPPASLVIFSCCGRSFFRVVRLGMPVEPSAWWEPLAHTRMLRELATDAGAGDRTEVAAAAH
jgi:hypothetical protein